jgi:shikimate kinase
MGVLAVFLVGFMGSGKSSVGQELARRLRWEFLDLDARIESHERRSISHIFQQDGEAGFRAAETDALRELAGSLQQNTIVALGGGALVQQTNRELIARWPSIFLDAPVDELWRRCSEDDEVRPLRRDREQFSRLYSERLPLYRQATATVETFGKNIAAICREIEQRLSLVAASPVNLATAQSDSSNSGCGGLK